MKCGQEIKPQQFTIEEIRAKFESPHNFTNVGGYNKETGHYNTDVVNRLWHGYKQAYADLGLIKETTRLIKCDCGGMIGNVCQCCNGSGEIEVDI
jgi:hypothetical protein